MNQTIARFVVTSAFILAIVSGFTLIAIQNTRPALALQTGSSYPWWSPMGQLPYVEVKCASNPFNGGATNCITDYYSYINPPGNQNSAGVIWVSGYEQIACQRWQWLKPYPIDDFAFEAIGCYAQIQTPLHG